MNYKLLGKSGLRVSEICLGTMTFGEEWGWGADKKESKKIFDAYAKAGGNFIDTANRYTEGTSEKFVGEFISSDRSFFVLATKYTLYDERDDVNASGNHRKNMMQSVERSLKRLKTDYIDLLWLHAWDFLTPVEEVMRALDDLVSSGKVFYIGVSDTPAWIVSRANTMAELRGWNPFIGLQIEYSLLQRTPERDLLPMAKELDIGVTPWAPLAGGALTGKYLQPGKGAKRMSEDNQRLSPANVRIVKEVVKIAEKIDCTPAQAAIRWLMQKNQVMVPIVGARKLSQMSDSLGVLDIQLDQKQMERLDKVSETELGFPHDFLNTEGVQDVIYGGTLEKIKNHRR